MERKVTRLREVGIPMTTMESGMRNERSDQGYPLANAVKTYEWVGNSAQKYGVYVILEVPHLYGIVPQVEQVHWVLRRLETDRIGIFVDSSLWRIIGYDPDAYLSELHGWHIHLRDSAGPDTEDFRQKLDLTPGDGTVDFIKRAQTVDESGYQGDVSIELEYRDMTLGGIDKEYDRKLSHLRKTGWELPESIKAVVDTDNV